MALLNCVRLRISRSRTPTSIKPACCSAVFTGTKRIVGRLIASQSASACTAGFDRDHRRRKLLEECEHLLASQLLAQNRLLGGVHPVELENVFRRIYTNSANLFHGRPPLSEIYSDLILARLMPSGAPHQQNFGAVGKR